MNAISQDVVLPEEVYFLVSESNLFILLIEKVVFVLIQQISVCIDVVGLCIR